MAQWDDHAGYWLSSKSARFSGPDCHQLVQGIGNDRENFRKPRLLQFHQKRCRVLSNSYRECEVQQKKSEQGPRGGERVVFHAAGFDLSCRWICSLFGVWIWIYMCCRINNVCLHLSPKQL